MTQVTQEDMRSALEELRAQLLGRIDGVQQDEEGTRQLSMMQARAVDSLEQAHEVLKKEFFDHVSIMEDKFKGDVEETRRQLVAVKGDIAEAKTRLSSLTAHVPETSVLPLHLTRRKGFDGIATYGGGVQWKDWRFSTVRWLSQEHKPFEELLQKIERLKKEPEEPEEGSPLKLGDDPVTPEQQW